MFQQPSPLTVSTPEASSDTMCMLDMMSTVVPCSVLTMAAADAFEALLATEHADAMESDD